MIEQILTDRCTRCGVCIDVCPTNVFDLAADGLPVIARQNDCQTCFMCELYCEADVLFVAPQCDHSVQVSLEYARRTAGQFRRESGWNEWSDDPRYANEHWRMERVFARARDGG
jgi:NAD-dependent dihydropyrimidine dehydrogenase PreA subunit